MVVCPRGHESDATDYCDECGTRLSGASTVPPSAGSGPGGAAPAATVCAICGASLTGRFCEECGNDSLAAPLDPPSTSSVSSPSSAPPAGPSSVAPPSAEPSPVEPVEPVEQPSPGAEPPTERGGASSATNEWWVVVTADREYYERVRAMDGPDADEVTFPLYCPERRFPLAGRQMLIGRRSRSRGVYPDIDLVGPPEDPAVSHTHALLLPQPDGRWSVIDLRSTNRTYVNGSPDPIDAERPVALSDGAVVHLGAWTRLTLRAGEAT
jgi:hypothetical protein